MEDRVDSATAAVVAHGLLNSMAIISAAAATLREAWDELDVVRRDQLLGMICDQAVHVSDLLGDVARGLPAGVLQELDQLTRSHQGDAGSPV